MESRLYDGADVQTPLFGEQQPRDRLLNVVISVVAVIIVTVLAVEVCYTVGFGSCGRIMPSAMSTLLTALFSNSSSPSRVLNVALALVVLMVCAGNLILVFWYRQGDVDPKFRKLIYFNACTIILLSVCANFYIFKDNCPK